MRCHLQETAAVSRDGITHLLEPAGDRRDIPFLDDRRVDAEVAVTDPGGPDAPVHEIRPGLASGPVAKMVEIIGLHVGQLRLSGNRGNAFVLHGPLMLPTYNE